MSPQRCRTALPCLPLLPARTDTRPGLAGGDDPAPVSPRRAGTLTVHPDHTKQPPTLHRGLSMEVAECTGAFHCGMPPVPPGTAPEQGGGRRETGGSIRDSGAPPPPPATPPSRCPAPQRHLRAGRGRPAQPRLSGKSRAAAEAAEPERAARAERARWRSRSSSCGRTAWTRRCCGRAPGRCRISAMAPRSAPSAGARAGWGGCGKRNAAGEARMRAPSFPHVCVAMVTRRARPARSGHFPLPDAAVRR